MTMKGRDFTTQDQPEVAQLVAIAQDRYPCAHKLAPRWFRTSRAQGRFVYVVVPRRGARVVGFLRDRVTVLKNRRNPYSRGGGFTQNERRYMPDPTTVHESRPRPFPATDRIAR